MSGGYLLGLGRLGDAVLGQLEGVVPGIDHVVLAQADDAVLGDLREVRDDLVVGQEVREVLVDQLVVVSELVVCVSAGHRQQQTQPRGEPRVRIRQSRCQQLPAPHAPREPAATRTAHALSAHTLNTHSPSVSTVPRRRTFSVS